MKQLARRARWVLAGIACLAWWAFRRPPRAIDQEPRRPGEVPIPPVPPPAVPPPAPDRALEPRVRTERPRRWRRPTLAALLLGVTVAAATGGSLLMPSSGPVASRTPRYKIVVLVNQPGVHATVVLDCSRLRPGAPIVADLVVALRPRGKSRKGLRFLVLAKTVDGGGRGPAIIYDEGGRPDLQAFSPASHTPASRSGLLRDADSAHEAAGAGRADAIRLVLPGARFAATGSKVAFVVPRVDVGDRLDEASYLGEASGGGLPPGTWYSPRGTAAVAGPRDLTDYRTDVASPAERAPRLWSAASTLTARWLGTDPEAEEKEQRSLFLAGVLFGVAGGALIGLIQDLYPSRFRDGERPHSNGPNGSRGIRASRRRRSRSSRSSAERRRA